MWQKTPIPMYNKIYYFNCTNAHDVMKYNSKPLLKQVYLSVRAHYLPISC